MGPGGSRNGCKALDVDSDGVADYQDIDPFTAPGVAVDVNGQELDDDMDGVPNSKDEESNSPKLILNHPA